jgi:hypothetical protein
MNHFFFRIRKDSSLQGIIVHFLCHLKVVGHLQDLLNTVTLVFVFVTDVGVEPLLHRKSETIVIQLGSLRTFKPLWSNVLLSFICLFYISFLSQEPLLPVIIEFISLHEVLQANTLAADLVIEWSFLKFLR